MMHYYQFNIADYRKDTSHLTALEHYIYRSLIDWYYLDEKPIPLETQLVSRRLSIDNQSLIFIENVLSDFFEKRDDGYHHNRIDNDILDYREMIIKNKNNGKLGGRPRKTQSVILANPNETQKKPNQELITNKPYSKGSRLNPDWTIPDDWFLVAHELNNNLTKEKIRLISQEFKDYWISVSGARGVKNDWLATWRNWIRKQNQYYPDVKKPNGVQL